MRLVALAEPRERRQGNCDGRCVWVCFCKFDQPPKNAYPVSEELIKYGLV